MAQAIEVALVRHGYTPVLCSQSTGGVHEDDYVTTLLDRGVSGIIFVSASTPSRADPERYRRLAEGGLPLVLVSGAIPGIGATRISADDAESAELAVSHLAQLGHRRIGLATGHTRYQPVVRRIEGFRTAMRAHVDPPERRRPRRDPRGVHDLHHRGWRASAAETLLDRGATAIVCGST